MAATYTGGDKASRSGSTLAERAYETASDKVGNVVGAGVDKVRDEAEGVVRVADDLRASVRRSLREQPMTTLAIAAAVGFILGAIWKD